MNFEWTLRVSASLTLIFFLLAASLNSSFFSFLYSFWQFAALTYTNKAQFVYFLERRCQHNGFRLSSYSATIIQVLTISISIFVNFAFVFLHFSNSFPSLFLLCTCLPCHSVACLRVKRSDTFICLNVVNGLLCRCLPLVLSGITFIIPTAISVCMCMYASMYIWAGVRSGLALKVIVHCGNITFFCLWTLPKVLPRNTVFYHKSPIKLVCKSMTIMPLRFMFVCMRALITMSLTLFHGVIVLNICDNIMNWLFTFFTDFWY